MATTYTVTANSEFGSTVSGKMYLTVPQSPITINLTNDTYRISGTFQFSHDFNGVSSIKFYSDSDISIGMRRSNDRSWARAITWQPSTTTTLNKGAKLSFVNNVDLSTSSVFNSANKTSRYATHYSDELEVWWGTSGDYAGGYISNNALVINYVLDAPPTFTCELLSVDPFVRVRLNDVVAKYNGDIVSLTLTLGEQTVTNTPLNNVLTIMPNTSGTFTPVVSVTDSRGQTTTKTLSPITVREHHTPITPVASRALTPLENIAHNVVNGLRVDMLIDCTQENTLTSTMPSNMELYDMNGEKILLPYISSQPYIRCYGIISATNQVPASNLSIAIANVNGRYDYATIGYPSTATPSQIKQEGETNLISPTIDVTNVRFNPETTGLNKYTVGDVIGVTTTNMTKSQTNVDNNVKHIITHASNVRINDTTTLQDWITEQYNYLIP